MLKETLGFSKSRFFIILRFPLLTLLLLSLLLFTGQKKAVFSEDLTHLDLVWDEFSQLPMDREDRCEKVIDIFSRLGAIDIFVEPVPKNQSDISEIDEPLSPKRIFSKDNPRNGACPGNVIVPLKSSGADYIIVCAHLDSSGEGVGALDDMSGVLILAALYYGLSDMDIHHDFIFVAFDREEEGLLGSKAFLEEMIETPLDGEKYKSPVGLPLPMCDITAVVNIECIGITLPHPWAEGSSDYLEDIFTDTGRRFDYDPSPVSICNVTADSITFLREGVPAITICGIEKENFYILGSGYDEPSIIDRNVFFKSYSIILEFLLRLDGLYSPLDAVISDQS